MISYTNNGDFKMKTAEWRGYTVKALEDIDKETKEIKCNIKTLDRKFDKLNESITLLRLKNAAIGGTVSLITALIISLLVKTL